MSSLPSPTDVLGAMITPAVLISAAGTLVLSTSNRLSRVVDRVRALAVEAERLAAAAPDPTALTPLTPAVGVGKRELIAGQIPQLAQRVLLLRAALTVFYNAIGLLVASNLGVGMTAILHWQLGWIAIGSGLVGATALFWGSVLLVREARLAVRSTLQEMDYVRGIMAGAGRNIRGAAPPVVND